MALTSTRFRKFSFTKVEDPSSCLFTGTHRRAFLFLHFYAYHRRSAFPAKHLSGRRISGFLYPHIFLFVSLICCAYFRRYFLFPWLLFQFSKFPFSIYSNLLRQFTRFPLHHKPTPRPVAVGSLTPLSVVRTRFLR